jgi:hypothetical protein
MRGFWFQTFSLSRLATPAEFLAIETNEGCGDIKSKTCVSVAAFCKIVLQIRDQTPRDLSQRSERNGRLGGPSIPLLKDGIEADLHGMVPRTFFPDSGSLLCWRVLVSRAGRDHVAVSA